MKVQLCFSMFRIPCANSANTLDVFFIVVGKYAKILLSELETMQIVVNRLRRMRQKSLSVHGDYGDFTVVLFIQEDVFEYNKSILACRENTLKKY